MNIVFKPIVAGLALALAACSSPTQSDVNQAARQRAMAMAKAGQAAQPAVDAANRNFAETNQNADNRIADATAHAARVVGKARLAQTKAQANADYNVAIARIEGNLKVAQERCGMQPANVRATCEQSAQATHDRDVNAAVAQLDAVEQRSN